MNTILKSEASLDTKLRKEEHINVLITLKEAALIGHLRKYRFGKFTVSKQHNRLVYVDINDHIELQESDGIAFQLENENLLDQKD